MAETLFQFEIGRVTIGIYKSFLFWGRVTLARDEGILFGFGRLFIWKRIK